MKRYLKASLFCILVGCSVARAYAQTSVTLYGIIDTGVEFISHVGPASEKLVRMPSTTGSLPSRWGFRGSEDLGGGYKATFVLESGFSPNSGALAQGGRLFGRQAWIGMESRYGTLSFGRQYTTTYIAVLENDIMGPAIYGIASLDAYIANARADNSVAYRFNFQGLTALATYSFGRDSTGTGNSPGQGTCAGQVPGAFTQCRDWSAMLKYDSDRFGAVVSYEEQRGGTNAAANFFDGVAPTPLSTSNGIDTRLYIDAYVKFLGATLSGGWLNRRVEVVNSNSPVVTSNMFFLGARYPVTPTVSVDGEVFRIINAQHDTRATLATLRGVYLLSKRSAMYVQGAYLFNSAKAAYAVSAGGPGGSPAPGVGQAAVMVGVRHLF
ncbi:porin [Paraburkholderia terrae]|uniref:porin n=1 Tax=Paraburkholderia TaxID=1822464 RepID=UPI001EE32644|nr:porin [Paraburkholderia terrae]BEU21202.1 porin [Paraburkholderia sp. 22B1P]